MPETAISIRNLAKRYRCSPGARRHMTLRDRLTSSMTRAWRRVTPQPGQDKLQPSDGFWALRNLSLDVAAGEVLGVIGHNGSGKSTLLKILARITEPSQGYAIVRGRVGALLEIGTGFHMELTGRENVYLSGAILGMRRAEIRGKFAAIVAMAGVEDFLEIPVKRYSTGMYLRLAFSVAAHLDSDILLLDEVLAVGDIAFQCTCQDKIRELANEGRTIVLVSHDLTSVRALCDRVLLLEAGQAAALGSAAHVIDGETSAAA
jgi:lipopolysaccharide transport system ATP-binding protein